MKQLHYGILSTSSIAPRFIAAVREANAGVIAALSSRTAEKAERKAKEWNVPKAYGSHMALLEDDSIDIVYISTVNTQHYPWAKAALEHGTPVICEKPCTTSAAQTRELYALAREKGLFFMEAEKMLFLPVMQQVRRRIQSGELGTVWMVEMSHSFSSGYNNWMFDPEAGGGPLLSSGIYAVQLLLWLFGPIHEIKGVHSSVESGVEWQYILTGTAGDGVLFTIKNSTRVELDSCARIYGTDGWLEIPAYWKARRAVFHGNGKTPEVVEVPCEHELIYEAQHIRECLEQGLLSSPVVTEEISAQGIAALERAKKNW